MIGTDPGERDHMGGGGCSSKLNHVKCFTKMGVPHSNSDNKQFPQGRPKSNEAT